MPLQSLNADILKVAMARVDALLRERARSETEIRLLLSIHDELLFEVRDGILNETAGAIRKVMEEVYTLSVPLRVEASAGKSWGELKPL
jgi:DNA polymerase-1